MQIFFDLLATLSPKTPHPKRCERLLAVVVEREDCAALFAAKAMLTAFRPEPQY